MARYFTSGFEVNSTTSGVEWAVTANAALDTSVVRSGQRSGKVAVASSGTTYGWATGIQPSSGGPYYFRFYLRITTLPAASNRIFGVDFATTSVAISTTRPAILLNPSGTLSLFNGTTQVGSDSPALSTGVWYRVEFSADQTPTNGARILRAQVDGAEFASSSAITTASNSISWFSVGGNLGGEANGSGLWYFDDVAVNTSTGNDQNWYPGPGRVVMLSPDGAGDSNQWNNTANAAGSSSNYQLVDENPPNDGTDLVQSGTANNQDLYNLTASGISSSDTVNVVQVLARHATVASDATLSYALVLEKTGSGTKAQGSTVIPNSTTWFTGSASSSGINTVGASLTSYADPDGAVWTQSTLDTLQAGPKIVAANTSRVQVSAVWATVDYTPAGEVVPQHRASTSGLVASGTLNLTVPASTRTGDMIIIQSVYKATTGVGTITTPTGYTLLAGPTDLSGGSANGTIWTKVAAGTAGQISTDAGATVALVPTSGTQQLNAVLGVYSGVDPTLRDSGYIDQGSTSSTSVPVGGETANSGDLIVSLAALRGASNGTITFTAPAGVTLRQQTTATSGSAQDVAAFLADSYVSGAQTFTASRAVWALTGQVVLKAPSSGSSQNSNPTDTVSAGDTVASTINRAGPVAETVSAAAAATTTETFTRNPTDATAVADSGSRSLTAPRSLGDTVAGSDVVASTASLPRGVSDASVAADVAARSLAAPRGVTDMAALADTASRDAVVVSRDASDNLTPSDAAVGTFGAVADISDVASVVDNPTGVAATSTAAADTVNAAGAAAVRVAFLAATADTLSAADAAAWFASTGVPVTDTVGFADLTDRLYLFARAALNSTTLADSAVRALTRTRQVLNTVSGSDAAWAGYLSSANTTDTVTVAGAAVVTSALSVRTVVVDIYLADTLVRGAATTTRGTTEQVNSVDVGTAGPLYTAGGADSVTVADAATRAHIFARQVAETIATGDVAAISGGTGTLVIIRAWPSTVTVRTPAGTVTATNPAATVGRTR